MTASTTSSRGAFGHRAGMLILGAMLACLGVFAFSGPAKAAPVSMDMTNGQINLGFAFKGAKILPAPPTVQLDDPPADPTALPDLWAAKASASGPDGTGSPPNDPTSFKPAGCITPVTFGLYAATVVSGTGPPAPGSFVMDPRPSGDPFGGLWVNPLANAGPGSDPAGGRELKTGAIVPAGETIGAITGPYPATDVKWVPYSVGGLPPAPPTPPGTKLVPNPSYSVACAEGNPASGTVDAAVGSKVKIGADDFRFPIMVVPNPTDNSPVPITLAATGEITGTFDSATGDVSLSGPIEARVLVGLASNPLGEYCAIPLEGLTLSTAGNADFAGVPYASGLGRQGALTGTFDITKDSTSVGGADCGTVDQVSKGAGSIWLSTGIAEPPACPEYTTGVPPNCEPIPCPEGFTGNEPDCEQSGMIGNLKLNAPKKVKSGKKFKAKVKVSNTGNKRLTNVRICLQTQKKLIKGTGKRCHTLSGLGAGKTKQVKFWLKSKRLKSKKKTKLKVVVSKGGEVLRENHVTVLTR